MTDNVKAGPKANKIEGAPETKADSELVAVEGVEGTAIEAVEDSNDAKIVGDKVTDAAPVSVENENAADSAGDENATGEVSKSLGDDDSDGLSDADRD